MKIAPHQTKKELRHFIGMINYYRDMWQKRSELLAPLASLTSKKVKWDWTKECQTNFDKMKEVLSREVLLSYPDFNKTFHIHTDASHTQLGSVISQDNKPIAFFSRNLNEVQTGYSTTERQRLSIVQTLKELGTILLKNEASSSYKS